MRTLSGALLAAQKAVSGVPYVRAVVSNKVRGMRHFVFAQTYSDGSADTEHGAAADGTYLHRVRVSGGNAQYQRDPSGSWTTLSSAATVTHVAIAAIGNARVIVLYNLGLAVTLRESGDQGASFGSEATVITAGSTVGAVAVAYKTAGGDCAVFYTTTVVRRVRRTSGTWGSAASWSQTAATLTGLAVAYYGDFNLVVTGTETTTLRPTLWSLVLGDGFSYSVDTWAAFFIQVQAEADESVVFQAPSIGLLEALRVTFVEKYSGAPAYVRTYWTGVALTASFSPGVWEWMDPAPLDDQANNGLAVTLGKNPQVAIYSRPGRVLEAAALTAVTSLDMSVDLVEATIEELDGLTQRAELVFDNSNGQYAGPPGPIALHRDVALGLGYGAAYSSAPSQSIVGWEYRRDGGRSRFVLRTRGNDYWLSLARTRTSIVDSRVMVNIARAAAARAGLDFLSSGASSRANSLSLGWVVHPQQTQLEVLRALAEIMPDYFLTYSVGTLLITAPLAADSSDYTYGVDHAIYESVYGADLQASAAEVVGVGELGQAWDFAAMNSDKPVQDRRRSPHETVQADVDAHAAARLRKSVLAKDLGELVTPPNCGLEVGDVVDFTDLAISGSAVKGRVRSIRTVFRRDAKARYEQRVALGGV